MPAEVVSIFDAPDFEEVIERGAATLKKGRLVILPTETVYGVAGILTHPEARTAIQNLRGTDADKPLTVHLFDPDQASQFLGEVSDLGRRMMKKLWPGPVGLVFDVGADRRSEVARTLRVDENLLYSKGSITLRCPDHIVAQALIDRAEAPVVLVQIPGRGMVTQASEIGEQLDEHIELVFDAGACKYAKPSTIVRVKGEKYEIERVGAYDDRIIQRLLRTTILFVCSGNTCRSPMAEALARKILSDKLSVPPNDLDKKGISVVSAGSYAMPGALATPQAVEAVKDLGADLSRHRSRPLSVELIHQADVIFGMGRGHTAAVASLVPSAMSKTSTLDPSGDIEDPIGSDVSVYRKLAGELEVLIEKRLKEANAI